MPDLNQDPKPNPPLDREARRLLAVIRHVEQVTDNVALTCQYFGISRQVGRGSVSVLQRDTCRSGSWVLVPE